MAKIENFEDLYCWASAKELGIAIYMILKKESFQHSNKEFIRFLDISKASLYEEHSIVLFYKELGFIDKTELDKILEKVTKTKHQILAFIKYLRKHS